MSDSPIKHDLSNFEDWVNKNLAAGKILTANDLHIPFFALLEHVRGLERRIEDLDKRHHEED